MSITITCSNHWKFQKANKKVDVNADTFMIILVNDFTFDKDAHATLADVIASPSPELPTGYGYTQQSKALTGGTLSEDDANDKASRVFDNCTWTADGGSIGPFDGCVVYDHTTSDDTVAGYIDLGQEYTISNGSSFQLQSIEIKDT